MPGVEKRMERTALAADYREVARRCRILEEAMRGATSLEVAFLHRSPCTFDLRSARRRWTTVSCRVSSPETASIKPAVGETFIVPYEGEQAGSRSQTGVQFRSAKARSDDLHRGGESVVKVEGTARRPHDARLLRRPTPPHQHRRVAFGCNEWAQVTGNVLEDEKAGFHWAYGRSDTSAARSASPSSSSPTPWSTKTSSTRGQRHPDSGGDCSSPGRRKARIIRKRRLRGVLPVGGVAELRAAPSVPLS